MTTKKITVLGGGSWGSVLAYIAALNGNDVTLWMRNEESATLINETKINKDYLPNLSLGPNVFASSNMKDIVDSHIVIFCVPSDAFRDISKKASPYINEGSFLITATKGVEKEGFSLMSTILKEHYPKNSIGILSGPNLAEEIASHQLSGTVIASKNKILRDSSIEALSTEFFKLYENDDPYGVEMGGALKNIYAIACGVADGLDSGENTIGMIMTRGLGEMSRLAEDLGANPRTFLGLAGVGDLITTCASPLSRNHQFGKLIGTGLTVDQAKERIGQTIEGLKTLKVVKKVSDEHNVEMPIVDSLYKIIYKGSNLGGSIQNVLGKDIAKDVEFIK